MDPAEAAEEQRQQRARAFERTLDELGVLKECAMFCKRRGVTLEQIQGTSRLMHIAHARHELMAFFRHRFPEWSFPAIGTLFNRDHTSVIHAVQKVKEKPVIVKVTVSGNGAYIHDELKKVVMHSDMNGPLTARMGGKPTKFFRADIEADSLELGDAVPDQNW